MKKLLGLIVSLIMILSAVGCMDNNGNLLPINPDSFDSVTNTEEGEKKPSSGNSIETEDAESSENNGESEENDDSSSNGKENKPSNETGDWTGFY